MRVLTEITHRSKLPAWTKTVLSVIGKLLVMVAQLAVVLLMVYMFMIYLKLNLAHPPLPGQFSWYRYLMGSFFAAAGGSAVFAVIAYASGAVNWLDDGLAKFATIGFKVQLIGLFGGMAVWAAMFVLFRCIVLPMWDSIPTP